VKKNVNENVKKPTTTTTTTTTTNITNNSSLSKSNNNTSTGENKKDNPKEEVYVDKHGRKLEFLTEFMRQKSGNYLSEEDTNAHWGGKPGIPSEDKGLARITTTGQLNDDSDKILRERERDGDPMAEYFREKHKKNKSKEPFKPVYKGPPPAPNRFNIPPGHKWDGIDRSNGFEDKYFKRIAQKSALVEEAYKWSVEDM